MILTVKIILTVLCALFIGILFFRLGIPGGMLVGALFGVGFYNIITQSAYMPSDVKIVSQIIIGAYIGCMVKKSDLKRLPHIIIPFLVIMVTFLILNIIIGLIVYMITPMDMITSLLCVMAGGVADTPLIAMDMNADAAKVATMQFVRLITGLGFMPTIIVWVDSLTKKKKEKQHKKKEVINMESRGQQTKTKLWGNPKQTDWIALVITLTVAVIGGSLGRISGVPAGTLLFASITTAILKINWNRAALPIWCRRFAQILTGCCVGVTITRNDVMEIKYLIIPIFLMMGGFVINCIIVGKILSALCHVSYREGMLYVLPAGASEMALVAEDMGIVSPDIAVIQIFRLILVMAIFPQVFNLLNMII